jgi:hypothetical protein
MAVSPEAFVRNLRIDVHYHYACSETCGGGLIENDQQLVIIPARLPAGISRRFPLSRE